MLKIIRDDIATHSEAWFVIFKLNFGHVWAVKPSGIGTVMVEPCAKGLIVEYIDHPVDEVLAAVKDEGAHVLSTTSRFSGYIHGGPQTCVTIVKSLLGLRAWHIITPKQLYRYMIKRGAHML